MLHILPDARADRTSAAAVPADRVALRLAPAPHQRQRASPPRPCTRSTSHPRRPRRRPPPRPRDPQRRPRSPAPRSNGRCRRSKDRPGPTTSSGRSCAPPPGTGFFPILWLTAMTGMRRNEVLGLKWPDIDVQEARLSLNRGLVAVGYELHQTRGKTRNARRNIDLDDTTLAVLDGWRAFQAAEFAAVGIDQRRRLGVHRRRRRTPSTPTPSTSRSDRIVRQRRRPTPSASTTCGTPTGACSSRKASPSRSCPNGSATPTSRSPSQTYQHLLPGMSADAARTIERLTGPVPTTDPDTVERRRNTRRNTA